MGKYKRSGSSIIKYTYFIGFVIYQGYNSWYIFFGGREPLTEVTNICKKGFISLTWGKK
ncbi:hypothetical protein ACONDI_02936 [Natranaerofaba carboxydovora]|nr:hypothetical protein ACONDI_02936 [Natranaerofaba carboxydovora]